MSGAVFARCVSNAIFDVYLMKRTIFLQVREMQVIQTARERCSLLIIRLGGWRLFSRWLAWGRCRTCNIDSVSFYLSFVLKDCKVDDIAIDHSGHVTVLPRYTRDRHDNLDGIEPHAVSLKGNWIGLILTQWLGRVVESQRLQRWSQLGTIILLPGNEHIPHGGTWLPSDCSKGVETDKNFSE